MKTLYQATAELLRDARGGKRVTKRDLDKAAKFIKKNNEKRREAGLSEIN